MLGNQEAIATVAVRDIEKAKEFYGDTLGLKQIAAEGNEAITYRSGSSKVIVYESEFAGTNQATAVNWVVGDDVERTAKELKAKGIAFEHYDMPGLTRKGDVHVAGDMQVAWFKDPDGNILSLVSG
jgi:catechol 2,3-dioxygenase-like lactoylglutathione lyase family enzyme